MLTTKILIDNNTLIDIYLAGEPGFSLWIEDGDENILFDTGYSDMFIKNAEVMGIDLTKAGTVVLSHGHSDHTWGLGHLVQYYNRRSSLARPKLVCAPEALHRKRHRGIDSGIMLGSDAIEGNFIKSLSAEPMKISKNITWLGEIPRKIEPPVSLGTIVDEDSSEHSDFCADDSALFYDARDGIVIITGCSHSGICNIVEYARNISGKRKILDIIGGFHMQRIPAKRMKLTVDYLKKEPPVVMHPCHCTDLAAKIELARHFDIREAGVGLELKYE